MRTEKCVRGAFGAAFQVHISVVVCVESSLFRTHLVFFLACHSWGVRHSAALLHDLHKYPSHSQVLRPVGFSDKLSLPHSPRSTRTLACMHTVALVFAVWDLILRAAVAVNQAGFAAELPRQAYQRRPACLCQFWVCQNFCRIATVTVAFTVRHQDASPPLEVAIGRQITLRVGARFLAKSTKTRA